MNIDTNNINNESSNVASEIMSLTYSNICE